MKNIIASTSLSLIFLLSAVVVKSECSDEYGGSVQKRAISKRMAGGIESIDIDSDHIKSVAARLVAKLDAESGSDCKRKVNQILQASTQVVAGSLHRLKLEICPDNCAQANECKICAAKVWVKEWMNYFEVMEYSCDEKKSNISQNGLTVEQLQFRQFAQKYNKQYESEEEKQRRFHIFRGNMKKIQMLNEGEQGTAEYGVNEFADLSKSEFTQYYLGLKPNGDNIEKQASIPNVRIPSEFDWRTHNAVTPVKNQGMCGSCWAFSVTGNIEGQYAIKHKNLVSLSEQELVDCDTEDNGCGGGYMTTAYHAIEKIGGLEQEKDYPYEGSNDKCVFNKSEVAAKVVDSVNITSNETEMAQWLFKNGPISIGLNAFAMQFYIRGVSKPWKFLCNPNELDHGVLIVGYGQYKKLPYWIIKNSWGPHWGESGYYRLYRGSGACGVNKMASSAIVD
ncbi:cathepsin L isoform X2 [Planococcus citri]|uniref:cathepsin L isoform X2 n=1 Tax=Planococcus citri TaxID=170843 RepID=UPI0031F8A65F